MNKKFYYAEFDCGDNDDDGVDSAGRKKLYNQRKIKNGEQKIIEQHEEDKTRTQAYERSAEKKGLHDGD